MKRRITIVSITITIVALVIILIIYPYKSKEIFPKGITKSEYDKKIKESKKKTIPTDKIYSNKETKKYNSIIKDFNSVNVNLGNILKDSYTFKPSTNYEILYNTLSYSYIFTNSKTRETLSNVIVIKFGTDKLISERYNINYFETTKGGGIDLSSLDKIILEVDKTINLKSLKDKANEAYKSCKEDKYNIPVYQIDNNRSVKFEVSKDKDNLVSMSICLYFILKEV